MYRNLWRIKINYAATEIIPQLLAAHGLNSSATAATNTPEGESLAWNHQHAADVDGELKFWVCFLELNYFLIQNTLRSLSTHSAKRDQPKWLYCCRDSRSRGWRGDNMPHPPHPPLNPWIELEECNCWIGNEKSSAIFCLLIRKHSKWQRERESGFSWWLQEDEYWGWLLK